MRVCLHVPQLLTVRYFFSEAPSYLGCQLRFVRFCWNYSAYLSRVLSGWLWMACFQFRCGLKTNYSHVHTSNLTESVSVSLLLNIFVPWSKSLDLRHVNDYSNTN